MLLRKFLEDKTVNIPLGRGELSMKMSKKHWENGSLLKTLTTDSFIQYKLGKTGYMKKC